MLIDPSGARRHIEARGIDVHEAPYLIATDHTPMEPNMVVVLEASTRRSDLGHICAEITCLVTEDGCEVLNALPYTITHIPQM